MTIAPEIDRPILRYHGGKWRLAQWIISQFPPHYRYIEPFAGAAAVLLQKSPAPIEVMNDLDGDVVNVFRVVRDPATAEELRRRLELTPYAREEWDASHELPADADDVERARIVIARSFMSHGTKGVATAQRTGFHTALSSSRDGNSYTRVTSWNRMPPVVEAYTQRLSAVMIENCDALELIARFDAPDALFYCDPPYLGHDRYYRCKFTLADHEALAALLRACKGMAIVSAYPSAELDAFYDGWTKVERDARAFSSARRVEVVYISPRAWAARAQFELPGMREVFT